MSSLHRLTSVITITLAVLVIAGCDVAKQEINDQIGYFDLVLVAYEDGQREERVITYGLSLLDCREGKSAAMKEVMSNPREREEFEKYNARIECRRVK